MSIKTPYEYTVVRYVHDPLTQEFLNVGIIMYRADAPQLTIDLNSQYGRISKAFETMDGTQYRRVMRELKNRVTTMNTRLTQSQGMFPEHETAQPLQSLLPNIWPIDDSSLRFSDVGVGMAADLEKALSKLYRRMVTRYTESEQRGRSEADIWRVFQPHLLTGDVLTYLKPAELVPYADARPYKFDHVWKNGVYRPFEPVSLDLVHGTSIRDKADRWITRANKFAQNDTVGDITILLGKPSNSALLRDYDRARSDFDKMARGLRHIDEAEAESFSQEIANEMTAYENG